jgi:Domain of unknown function (DUF6817)
MSDVRDLLVSLGAGEIGHAGASLLEHLGRTHDRLAAWGADEQLQTVGLAHAFYGTDGFDRQLLTLDQRSELREVIGEAAEAEVYLYASCGRDRTYPHLSDRPAVLFYDRFTGTETLVDAAALRWFAELTAANELDVFLHLEGADDKHRAWLLDLVGRMRDLLTDAAWSDCTRRLDPSTG